MKSQDLQVVFGHYQGSFLNEDSARSNGHSLDGGLGGTRTPDALLRTEALYPLSYEAADLPSVPGGPNPPGFAGRADTPNTR